MAFHEISLTVNGSLEQIRVPSNLTLMRLLRESLALTGTKNGCSAGECGACTVLLNGEPVNSCMVLAVNAMEPRSSLWKALRATGSSTRFRLP